LNYSNIARDTFITRGAHRLKTISLAAAWASAALLISAGASGQSYPAKPVRLIVPFTPGGGTDIATRMIAPKLSERFGQTAFVDNRAGAAGAIGAEATVRSAPDGYTLLVGSTSEIGISPMPVCQAAV
jgi:tripartite-type tricarboxylate transporter receptor subunit TctC